VANLAKAKVMALTGNDAAAYAMKAINPDVVAAFPITPQTEMMHKFADFVNDGDVVTEFVTVESEHSAMSATVGAAAAGARSMTATSANGLALMWEIVYIAASLRLPIVMPMVNRALSGPINIHCDHSDSMGCRDSGWLQFHCENVQEIYDNIIMAVRISEHPEVMLPSMVCFDGFILSHTMDRLELPDDEIVRKWIGPYDIGRNLLDTENPITFGPLDFDDYNFERKRQEAEAQYRALEIIPQIVKEYGEMTGRTYEPFFVPYRTDDAEIVLVGCGSTMGTAHVAVDRARAQGIKVGLLKIRTFRPWNEAALVAALANAKTVAILDRSFAFNAVGGPLFTEIRSALYSSPLRPRVVDYVYGIGGRDINVEQITTEVEALAAGKGPDAVGYINLRE
jgi:pyruvate ferredoxin oxidoreductase alpha subunit